MLKKTPQGAAVGDDDVFAFNDKFTNKQLKIKINSVQVCVCVSVCVCVCVRVRVKISINSLAVARVDGGAEGDGGEGVCGPAVRCRRRHCAHHEVEEEDGPRQPDDGADGAAEVCV